ncbi:MAG: ABC transporter permease [Clostridiales bacterium]|jgi:ABC-2 type transport system permease protein|nr:ABC transporter permease [Clostridiales bacterium]
MKQFKTIFLFEFGSYLKNKAFLIITAIILLAVIAVPCVPTVAGLIRKPESERETSDTRKAAVVSDILTPEILARYFSGTSFEFMSNADQAEEIMENGGYKFLLEADETDYTIYMNNVNIDSFAMLGNVEDMLRELRMKSLMKEYGLDEEAINDIYSIEITGRVRTSEGAADEEGYFQNYIYAYVLLFLLYMVMVLYGQQIVVSVVTEKSSKAMEILITSAKPLQLMFGKVFGVGLAGLLQFFSVLAAGAVSFSINGIFWADMYFADALDNVQEVAAASGMEEFVNILAAPVSPMLFVYLGIFFILGFFIYAFLFAAFASTASRIEEGNTVVAVPMLLIVVGFMGAIFGMMVPGAMFVKVLSYIPFTSSMVMFMRVCMGSAGALQAWISIVILAVSVVLCAYLGAKVYRTGVLMYGKPPKFAEIFKIFLKAKV